MDRLDRRSFLRRGGAFAGAAVASPYLHTLARASSAGALPAPAGAGRRALAVAVSPYGPLAPAPDQNGDEILALPPDFTYVTFSRTGEAMSDGSPVPRNHDGMGAFAGPAGTVRLIRNHEVRNAPGHVAQAVLGPEGTKYDPLGVGGTVTLDYDPRRGALVRDFVSLNGTIVNCAGGLFQAQLGWITCEETVAGPRQGWARPHGYAFLVPARADATVPRGGLAGDGPLRPRGRGAGPALRAHLRDRGLRERQRLLPVPACPSARPDARRHARDARRRRPAQLQHPYRPDRRPVPARPLGSDPRPDPDIEAGRPDVAAQGLAGGGALFNRLEGIWYDVSGGYVYFCSTSGGNAGYGQVWRYDPHRAELVLYFESPGGSVLDSPDNLLVTPRGGLLLCEDDASDRDDDTHPLAPGIVDVNRIVGLTPDAEAFEFAVNRLNDSEFAGACFSPDGRTLFVNIFGDASPGSGMTCAITGPWHIGPL